METILVPESDAVKADKDKVFYATSAGRIPIGARLDWRGHSLQDAREYQRIAREHYTGLGSFISPDLETASGQSIGKLARMKFARLMKLQAGALLNIYRVVDDVESTVLTLQDGKAYEVHAR